MILVGIDDTDTLDSRGTNQLAKHLARMLDDRYRCIRIVRHQLLFDERVPYTSKNGSASIWLEPQTSEDIDSLIESLRTEMQREFIPGSDPGLCVTDHVPDAVIEFAKRCQTQLVTAAEALETAERASIHVEGLEGLGGTCDGVIGALAAVGLAATGNDGRIVHWQGMDGELSGQQPLAEVLRRNVRVCSTQNHGDVAHGTIDVGKKLRPNLRDGRHVLFARPINGDYWQAEKLP